MGEMEHASFPVLEPEPEREAELEDELALSASDEQVGVAAHKPEDLEEVQAELVLVLDEVVYPITLPLAQEVS